MTGEPDLWLQEGAISSTHTPSDNNPGTAPSSATSDMVRMLKEWTQEKERKKPALTTIKKPNQEQAATWKCHSAARVEILACLSEGMACP